MMMGQLQTTCYRCDHSSTCVQPVHIHAVEGVATGSRQWLSQAPDEQGVGLGLPAMAVTQCLLPSMPCTLTRYLGVPGVSLPQPKGAALCLLATPRPWATSATLAAPTGPSGEWPCLFDWCLTLV